jgi:hypothetical protein
MALGTSAITRTGIRTETGLTSYAGSVLMGAYQWLNPYSFYGPCRLSVDVNKDIILLIPTLSKQGDYRGYNHTATMPHASANFTITV